MSLQLSFEVPASIRAGLDAGRFERVGGVIRWAKASGRTGIVAWLRELSSAPMPPSDLASTLSAASRTLSAAGSVASVVNLGATLAFGTAALIKLGKIESELGNLGAGLRAWREEQARQLDALQATVDLGFACQSRELARLLASNEDLQDGLERRVLASLAGAERDFGLAVVLDSQDARRAQLLPAVLSRVTDAHALLRLEANHDRKRAVASVAQRRHREKLSITARERGAVAALRMAGIAAAQRAEVMCELGFQSAAARFLREEATFLREGLRELGERLFKDDLVYDDLLNVSWAGKISPERIDRWAARFDAGAGGLAGAIRRTQAQATHERAARRAIRDSGIAAAAADLRRSIKRMDATMGSTPDAEVLKVGLRFLDGVIAPHAGPGESTLASSSLTPIDADVSWSADAAQNLVPFLDDLDGAWEDADRLEGHAVEYDEMVRRGLDASAYRKMLTIDDTAPGAFMAVLISDAPYTIDEVLDAEPSGAGHTVVAGTGR